jgi:uncharacterized protein YcbK (DUF882 family)
MNWANYPNFKKDEFDCKHTGKNEMQPDFMTKLQAMRTEAGFPFRITSGYRDATHPVEAKKTAPGWHSRGRAADIACDANTAHRIVSLACKHGFTGIGVSQRAGQPRFVHVDTRDTAPIIYGY